MSAAQKKNIQPAQKKIKCNIHGDTNPFSAFYELKPKAQQCDEVPKRMRKNEVQQRIPNVTKCEFCWLYSDVI